MFNKTPGIFEKLRRYCLEKCFGVIHWRMQVLGSVMELGIRDNRLGMRKAWRHSGQDAVHETT
eukprot:1157160-Pelagomonas_calceolata.AAC.6